MINAPMLFGCVLAPTENGCVFVNEADGTGFSSFRKVLNGAMNLSALKDAFNLSEGSVNLTTEVRTRRWLATLAPENGDMPKGSGSHRTESMSDSIIESLAGLLGIDAFLLTRLFNLAGVRPEELSNVKGVENATAKIAEAFVLGQETLKGLTELLKRLSQQGGNYKQNSSDNKNMAEEITAVAVNEPVGQTGSTDISEALKEPEDSFEEIHESKKGDFELTGEMREGVASAGAIHESTDPNGAFREGEVSTEVIPESAEPCAGLQAGAISTGGIHGSDDSTGFTGGIAARAENNVLTNSPPQSNKHRENPVPADEEENMKQLIERLAEKFNMEIRKLDKGKSSEAELEVNSKVFASAPDLKAVEEDGQPEANPREKKEVIERIKQNAFSEGSTNEFPTQAGARDTAALEGFLNSTWENIEYGQAEATEFRQSVSSLGRDITYQIVEKAKLILTGDKSEMEMDLKPESLGRITLKVVTEQGAMAAKIIADNHQVKQLLETNMQTLKDALERQGINVQWLSVSVRQESGGNPDYHHRNAESVWGIPKYKATATVLGGLYGSLDAADNPINPYLADGSTINLIA